MPVVWRETDFDVSFLLYDIYRAEHDSLHEAVHGEAFHFSTLEERVLHPVSQDEGCRIEEQSEVVHVQRPLPGLHESVNAQLPLLLRAHIELAPCSSEEIVETLRALVVLHHAQGVTFLLSDGDRLVGRNSNAQFVGTHADQFRTLQTCFVLYRYGVTIVRTPRLRTILNLSCKYNT